MADQCIVCLETLDFQADPPPLGAESAGSGFAPAPLPPERDRPASPISSTAAAGPVVTAPGDHIDNHDSIAVIDVCGHTLHDTCLREWTGKANSCPICRQSFHLVHVYDKVGGELPPHARSPSSPPPAPDIRPSGANSPSRQAPSSHRTRSRIANKLPSSTRRNGSTKASRKRRQYHVRSAAKPTRRTSSCSVTAATPPTTHTASASTGSPTAPGSAWSAQTWSIPTSRFPYLESPPRGAVRVLLRGLLRETTFSLGLGRPCGG